VLYQEFELPFRYLFDGTGDCQAKPLAAIVIGVDGRETVVTVLPKRQRNIYRPDAVTLYVETEETEVRRA
jgi:hypothetical protein